MELEQWKQKYYNQLDELEKKEQDWEKLETVLKRTIGRLSLAAEGHNKTLDRHIGEVRGAIKSKINPPRLDSIVDDISKVLSQLEEKQGGENKSPLSVLQSLLEQLTLPKAFNKTQKKLLKQFANIENADESSLLKQTRELIESATATEAQTAEKPGLLDRLFTSKSATDTEAENAISDLGIILQHTLQAVPWPDNIKTSATEQIQAIKSCKSEQDLKTCLDTLQTLIQKWPDTITPTNDSIPSANKDVSVENYKTCLLDLLNKLDNPQSPNGKLAAIRLGARDAHDQQTLDKLSEQLSTILADHSTEEASAKTTQHIETDLGESVSHDPSLQPSIQELLIRLLEQLIVPTDLQSEADAMKQRLEKQTEPADWKDLLKDVAQLINSIRSRMQQEKHEFEDFLQQVTNRLKAMDQFLQSETDSLQKADTEGKKFDSEVKQNVDDIRLDIDQATELSGLKAVVNTKLDTISDHIKLYRDTEQSRINESQQQVIEMHDRMQSLEKEADNLKRVVIEKNKQAMFDALTGIPNRLAYEKKVEEEIARWKRFKNPLSLVVWDIDFFKKVNDTFGHKAGDKVLKTVAQLLNKRIRATDFLARYGGEEFVMLLPGTKQEETLRLVNNLREQVQECGFHYHGEAVKITVSCGISSFNDGDTLGKVFERADQSLYKAKENGRNQCVAASCLSD